MTQKLWGLMDRFLHETRVARDEQSVTCVRCGMDESLLLICRCWQAIPGSATYACGGRPVCCVARTAGRRTCCRFSCHETYLLLRILPMSALWRRGPSGCCPSLMALPQVSSSHPIIKNLEFCQVACHCM